MLGAIGKVEEDVINGIVLIMTCSGTQVETAIISLHVRLGGFSVRIILGMFRRVYSRVVYREYRLSLIHI